MTIARPPWRSPRPSVSPGATAADRTEAQAASILDWALAMSGQLDQPTNLERALDLYRSLDDVPGEAACLTNLGALAYLDGRWPEAVDYYRQGQAAHARSGDETSAALGAANTGEVLSDQGHWEDAVAALTEALEVWRATGHEHGVAYALGLLGRAHARRSPLRRSARCPGGGSRTTPGRRRQGGCRPGLAVDGGGPLPAGRCRPHRQDTGGRC